MYETGSKVSGFRDGDLVLLCRGLGFRDVGVLG